MTEQKRLDRIYDLLGDKFCRELDPPQDRPAFSTCQRTFARSARPGAGNTDHLAFQLIGRAKLAVRQPIENVERDAPAPIEQNKRSGTAGRL